MACTSLAAALTCSTCKSYHILCVPECLGISRSTSKQACYTIVTLHIFPSAVLTKSNYFISQFIACSLKFYTAGLV